MRSPASLRTWMCQLLPEQPCAGAAAHELTRALLANFTTHLTQLARQADRTSTTKGARQRFARWLAHPAWDPKQLYTRLLQRMIQALPHLFAPPNPGCPRDPAAVRPLLVDATDLADGWFVLQVSLAFEQRALPLLRLVRRYQDPEQTQAALLEEALVWLGEHLPGPRSGYVLVMDRGFPSHALIRWLTQEGWRFVLRLQGSWKLTHPEHTGCLRTLPWEAGLARCFSGGVLGSREKGEGKRLRHCGAHVVAWYEAGSGHPEPWFLVSSDPDWQWAVAIYRQRMGIEHAFRDVKGPWGLDQLARWEDAGRVAAFLAWVAVYEWRLAYLWVVHELRHEAKHLRVKGPLSWIRTVREWLARQSRQAALQATEGL